MFKCPMSYCIPYRYLCNGRWDCWNGDDEYSCDKFTCVGMVKCRNAHMCLHVDNTCDGFPDCPLGEDESICTGMVCVKDCVCLNHGIHCDNLICQDKLTSIIKHYIFVNISNSYLPYPHLQGMGNPLTFISNNCTLTESVFCESFKVMNLNHLDLTSNKIQRLTEKHLRCLPHLVQFILKLNQIKTLKNSPFQHQQVLDLLDMSGNKIDSLGSFAFSGMQNLKLLKILDNPIKQVHQDCFKNTDISLVHTFSFHCCCMISTLDTLCTAKPVWPFSCDSLLFKPGVRVGAWFMGIIVIFSNLASVLRTGLGYHVQNKLNEYQKLVLSINICDLMKVIYLLIVVLKDMTAGENYIGDDLGWRKSFFCYVAAACSSLSVLLSANFLFFISISRYQILKDPLAKFKDNSNHNYFRTSTYVAAAVVYFTAIVLFTRYNFESLPQFSSPFCLLFGSSYASIIEKILTAEASLLLLVTFSCIILLHWKMLKINRLSVQVLDSKKKEERQKTLRIHIVVASVTNALCWGPSSLFFLVSGFLDRFPVIVLHVITIFVLPINCVMNPYIFHLSEIKKQTSFLWGKLRRFFSELE